MKRPLANGRISAQSPRATGPAGRPSDESWPGMPVSVRVTWTSGWGRNAARGGVRINAGLEALIKIASVAGEQKECVGIEELKISGDSPEITGNG